MNLGLEGKVAALGGATSGIGLACAEALLKEGARVCICGRDETRLEEALQSLKTSFDKAGGEVSGVSADLSTAAGVTTFLNHTRDKLGPVEVLLVNTGGPPSGAPQDHDDTRWRHATDLLLMSAVRLMREVTPEMAGRGWGRIVLITSISVRQPLDDLVLSNALRCGVTGLAKTYARQLAPRGITVNCVCPGFTQTERLESLAETQGKKRNQAKTSVLEGWSDRIPAKRLGRPEEIASAVTFFSSKQAGYITGTSLCVDGGWTHALL